MPSNTNAINFWRTKVWRTTITIIGFLLLVIGTLGIIFWPQLFDQIVSKEMILRPNSNVYNNWKVPPVELVLDIYLFNWTNPEDFKNHNTKPILKQCGPYRFIENSEKVDIQWHPENASVSYRKRSFYKYYPEKSQGQLDDQITTLNAVALTGASKAKYWENIRRKMVDVGLTMYDQERSVTKSVDELLFTGYSDEMIDVARAVPIFGTDIEVPFDKFGWFYTRNGSAELTGVYTVFTGADNILKLGQMYSWNYKTNTGFYDSYCGIVNGSAGEFQPPHITKHSVLQLFTPDLCRTISLRFKEVKQIEGIQGYKFVGDANSVDNGDLNPENKCFCGGECAPSGVINVTSCRFGSPVFMSYPHFYQADKVYVEQVEGLQPNVTNHEFYIIVEPSFGTILEIAARFQVNMLVEPIQNISLYENVPRMYFPLIWFEQKVRISPKLAIQIRLLPVIVILGQVFFAIMLLTGIVMLCWYTIKKTCTPCWIKSKTSESADTKTGKCRTALNVPTSPTNTCKTDSQFIPIKPLLMELNSKIPPESRCQEGNTGSLM